MTLGPQFYPRHESVSSNISLRKDAPLYHGTGGDIEGGVVRPAERQLFGPGAYGTESPTSAEFYAKMAAESEGRLFGTIYEVSPVTDDAQIAGTEAGKAVVTDPEGMKTKGIVGFPAVHDYSEEHKAHAEAVDRIAEFFR